MAYPRITLYDSLFSPVRDCPLHFEANSAAEVSTGSFATKKEESSTWVNISYPRYRATVYCAFVRVGASTVDDVLANRIERISLNSGGMASELVEFTNVNGFDCHILVTNEAVVTPVQFLSTDNDKWVVSGVLTTEGVAAEHPDSLAPIIKGVERDLIHALKTLGYK